MSANNRQVAVVGAGMLGMVAALKLADSGFKVQVIEAADQIGGQTTVCQFGNFTWDRYYHVISPGDVRLLELIKSLGIEHMLRWSPTRTGFYAQGGLHSMSNAMEFLRFPLLSLPEKVRLASTILRASSIKDLAPYESETSTQWLRRWSGDNVTDTLWSPLLQSKFGEQFEQLSAAFIIRTLQRMFGARKAQGGQELFGYVSGGYQTILTALRQRLAAHNVLLATSSPVNSIVKTSSGFDIVTATRTYQADKVVLTAAAPLVPRMCPQLMHAEKQRYEQIDYLGIVCACLLLQTPLSPYYITNIIDRNVPFTGVIEMSALVDEKEFSGHSLVYIPRYLPSSSMASQPDDGQLRSRYIAELERMYPHFNQRFIKAFDVARTTYVLPLPTAALQKNPLSIATSISGLYAPSTAHITEGVLTVDKMIGLAEECVRMILST